MTLHTTLRIRRVGASSLGVTIPRWYVREQGLEKGNTLQMTIGEWTIALRLGRSGGHGGSFYVTIPKWYLRKWGRGIGDPIEVVIE